MAFGFAAKKKLESLDRELREAAQNLSDLEKRYNSISAVFDSMVEGVIAVDRGTRIISLNPSAEKLFSISRQEAADKLFLEAFRNNEIAEIISRCLETGKFFSQEVFLVWPLKRDFQVNASPIFEKGGVSGCLVVIHDITEIGRLETIRKDFVANVSHELKTPLTAIKGFVETLIEGALDNEDDARNFLKIILEHTTRLDNLVNDLLDLSQLESEGIKLELEQVELQGLADKAISSFKSKLRKRSIEVNNELPASLFLRADKDKLEQVFINLIDNAIKFNNDNETIKIYAQDSGKLCKVFIEDSGIGIPAKDIARIFERFYRVDKARSRELGGTGLGLSIVKHIVALHGGEAGVESTEGLGSKFWFTLPQ